MKEAKSKERREKQVHRHHPPLVCGREMGTEPAQAEGAAVCRFEGAGRRRGEAAKAAADEEGKEADELRGGTTTKALAAISYRLPEKALKDAAKCSQQLPPPPPTP